MKGEYDTVVKQEESRVREAGGLHVIGTERHESAVSITNCVAVPVARATPTPASSSP